ncbi:MAG TPA: hypothetical protein VLZ78_06100 [Terrimesophilobacter sp.]|nr:hypothetical protein [Terrimesophilobacter sp.]
METNNARSDNDDTPGDALTRLEVEIQALASTEISRIASSPDEVFERAAALRDNAMGIIYDGDGSTDTERVGRLLALIPALLTVVDEARDTIARLRDLAGEPDAPKAISPYDAAGRDRPARPRWGKDQSA